MVLLYLYRVVLVAFIGAIDDYSKAIMLNPDDADAYLSRGSAKNYLEDYNGAIDDYSNCLLYTSPSPRD